MKANYKSIISWTLILKFEEDYYDYSALGELLTILTDDIHRAVAMNPKNYFKLSKCHSKDGRDYYFYFTVEFSKKEVGVSKFCVYRREYTF